MRADSELSPRQQMQEETRRDRPGQHTAIQERWEIVWERSRAGRHTMVVGPHTLPPAPPDLQVLRVQCDVYGTSGGALDAARRAVADLLGEELQAPEPRRAAYEPGLRQRLWGDMPGPSLDALLVEACNRLATRSAGRAVLAFEAIDAADAATMETIAQILQRPGWLRLPLLLTMRGVPQGRVAELVYLLHRDDGEAAVMAIEDEATPEQEAVAVDWTMLPADVLRVLRASAVLGTSFEAELVAQLLEEPLSLVLEKLQEATDAGVPLVDRGAGRLTWPGSIVAALQQSTLPSLLKFWHARLGEILSGSKAPDRASRARPAPRTVTRRQSAAEAEPAFDLPGRHPEADRARLFEPPRPSVLPTQAAPPSPLPGDHSRAATHWQAAGQTAAAVAHYLAAVREAAARGDARRAYGLAEQGLTLLDQLPAAPTHGLLRAQLLLEEGRLQWHGSLLGSTFTLQEALASLEAAKASLPDDVPLEVVEQLAAVTAGVCYDVGDQGALQRALAELQESSQRLVQAGAILPAARLLNDQAAVYMRLGDPVRATYLLSQAHERFEHHLRQHQEDAMALAELAQTKHLLARLPLHVQVPPGREEESAVRGLEHARATEHIYQRLGQQRELTRVWETMGRLALQQGNLEVAQERLMAAHNLQQQLGDAAGLARSTAALADMCMLAGQLDHAVALLADSITLNVEKGSLSGLAFNRQALGALTRTAAQAHRPDAERLRGAVADLANRLAQAEAVHVHGRVALPGEASGQMLAPLGA
jgi:tetratricopeptide (TPR) repeat protein